MLKLLRLAVRNVTRNRRRTALALSALVVGVLAMIVLRGYINGARLVFFEAEIRGSTGALQVHKKGYLANVLAMPLTFDMADSPELRAKLAAIPGVTGVAPRITFGAMAAVPDAAVQTSPDDQGRTAYFSATAIDPALERKVTPKRWDWVHDGRVFSTPDADEIVLNREFNHGLRAPLMAETEGHPDVSRWPALLSSDRDGALNGANVRMVGTYESALPGDRKSGLVPLATAQRLLHMEGRVTEYALAVDDFLNPQVLNRVKAEAQSALGPEYEVSTWQDLMPILVTAIKAQDAVTSSIIGIFFLVALLGVVNTMLMSVLERTREIGTMMAVGTRRSQIVILFMLEGAIAGLVGGTVGAVLGYGLTRWLGHIGINLSMAGGTPQLVRAFVSPPLLFIAVAVATVGSAVAALYPAFRASRLRPVEALATT